MPISTTTSLDYLIDGLRLHLGDTDSTAYRYTTEWLRTALVAAFKELMRWWNFKYLISATYVVSRNPNVAAGTFLFPSPPLIQYSDERPIILMASIIIKEGSLENASWSLGSWRDAEIAYSNIEAGRAKQQGITKDWETLISIVTPPNKRLAQPKKQSLPGYTSNVFEKDSRL